jgi:sugar lactone lactonase YvrE
MKKQVFFLLMAGVFQVSTYCTAQIIVTYAGNGLGGFIGDGGLAIAAEFYTPSGVYVDTSGNIYITDQNASCVRKVNTAGIIVTVAGVCGSGGYTGDGGPATAAGLTWPEGVAVERNGNIYIADQFNNAIRKVDHATGIITTIAGNGTTGYGGDGGVATAAVLWHPADVGVDYNGNVYFVDQDNSRMRKITRSTGIITTLAGNGTSGFSGDGGPGTAAKLNFPAGIAVDSIGNVFIADFYNSRIRKVDTAGIITTIAGNGTGGYGGDGGPATAAELYDASAVWVDRIGRVYISDYYNSLIRKVDTSGIISTIAGNDTAGYRGDCGPATAGEIYYPQGVAVDKAGNVYIADFDNHRVRMVTDGPVCPSLGINNEKRSGFMVVPNPSTGPFTIYADNALQESNVVIYNCIGERVYECMLGAQKEINLSSYNDGIYIIYVKNGEAYSHKKIIIRH